MEIKIDTKKDSKDDIKQVIAFLQKIVDEGTASISNYDTNVSEGAFNMFDDDSTSNSTDDDEKEDSIEKIEIIEY